MCLSEGWPCWPSTTWPPNAVAGWALLPTAALALTTPMLYFTRTPFTEPTNIVLTFAGLAVIVGRAAPTADPDPPAALAGGMLGANALSRIDGAAVTAGLVLGLGLVAAGLGIHSVAGSWCEASSCDGGRTGHGGARLPGRPGQLHGLPDGAPFVYVPLMAMLAACLVAALVAIARRPSPAGLD